MREAAEDRPRATPDASAHSRARHSAQERMARSARSGSGSAPSPARSGAPLLPYRERLNSPPPAPSEPASLRLPLHDSMQASRPPSPGTGEGLRSQAQGEGATAEDARRTDRKEHRTRHQAPGTRHQAPGTR